MTQMTYGIGPWYGGDAPALVRPRTRKAEFATATDRERESILVVEDDEIVRETIGEFLRLEGYRVMEAGDGEQAWDRFRRRAKPFDILVADVVMPGWSGLTLAEELLEADPRVKVLLTSGYALEADVKRCMRSSRVAFLAKPFNRSALSTAVRDLLDGRNVRNDD